MKFILSILSLLCQFAVTSAYADGDDTINFIVGTDYRHYDNLFQLPDDVKPGGSGAERSDNILKTTLGVDVNKKYGMQTFKVNFSHVDSRYDNASFLNFKANNYKAAWMWALTPSLRGYLSAERNVDLLSFSDYRNTNTQNIRTNELQLLNFDWSPHHVWHLIGGLTRLKSLNSQAFDQETSFKFDATNVGLKYSFPSDSYVMLDFRKRNGENQAINPSNQIGKGFSEDEAELSSAWNLTGGSKLSSNLGYNSHSDDTFELRDFSGFFGGLKYTWSPRNKLNITVDLSRRIASYQDVTSSFTTNDALKVQSSWALTSKVTLSGFALISKRKFLGDGPGPQTPQNSPTRVDDGNTIGAEMSWVPRSGINIALNIQHDERDSNYTDRNFSSNTVGVNGQLTF